MLSCSIREGLLWTSLACFAAGSVPNPKEFDRNPMTFIETQRKPKGDHRDSTEIISNPKESAGMA